MKSVGRILAAVMMILATLLMGVFVAMALKSSILGSSVSEMQTQVTEMKNLAAQSPALAKEIGSKLEAFEQAQSQMRLYAGEVIVVAVAALAVVILAFMKRTKPLIAAGAVGLVVSVGALAMFPKGSKGDDLLALQAITMLYAIMAAAGFLVAKLSSAPARQST